MKEYRMYLSMGQRLTLSDGYCSRISVHSDESEGWYVTEPTKEKIPSAEAIRSLFERAANRILKEQEGSQCNTK